MESNARTTPKFVQLVAVREDSITGIDRLYALDEDGGVWRTTYLSPGYAWERVEYARGDGGDVG